MSRIYIKQKTYRNRRKKSLYRNFFEMDDFKYELWRQRHKKIMIEEIKDFFEKPVDISE